MKVETANHYFVRCDKPGCMAGYLGWGEKCPDCNGGWIDIPEVQKANRLRGVLGYVGFFTVLGVVMYFLFR